MIPEDSSITYFTWVAFRGSIYIKFQKPMWRRLLEFLTCYCMAYDLAYALGDQQMETQFQKYMCIMV